MLLFWGRFLSCLIFCFGKTLPHVVACATGLSFASTTFSHKSNAQASNISPNKHAYFMSAERIEALMTCADAGDAEAQYQAAQLLSQNSDEELEELEHEKKQELYDKVIALLKVSAAQGFVASQVDLGRCMLTRRKEGDVEEAVELLHAAAEQGDQEAYVLLGKVYSRGLEGVVEADKQEAARCVRGGAVTKQTQCQPFPTPSSPSLPQRHTLTTACPTSLVPAPRRSSNLPSPSIPPFRPSALKRGGRATQAQTQQQRTCWATTPVRPPATSFSASQRTVFWQKEI
jgi:hypothetical protein